MPSQLERAITEHRFRLQRRDAATLSGLFDAFQMARDRLQPRIGLLEAEIAGMETPNPNDVLQLSRWLELERQLTVEVQQIANALGPKLQADQRTVLAESWEHTRHLALVSGGSDAITAQIATGWAKVPVDAMQDLIAGLAPNAPVGKLLGGFGSEAAERARNLLIEASSRGLNPNALTKALADTLDISRNRAATIARTELHRSARNAALRQYRANGHLLSGWVWTAAHQTRTCLCCLALDGRTFSLNVDFFPGHPNCRCTTRPRVIGEPATTQQTGAEWFAAQPESVQREMLPASAHDAWFSGKLSLEDFVQKDRSPIWGDSYRQSSVQRAMGRASGRTRSDNALPRDTGSLRGQPPAAGGGSGGNGGSSGGGKGPKSRFDADSGGDHEEILSALDRLYRGSAHEHVEMAPIHPAVAERWPTRSNDVITVNRSRWRHAMDDHPDHPVDPREAVEALHSPTRIVRDKDYDGENGKDLRVVYYRDRDDGTALSVVVEVRESGLRNRFRTAFEMPESEARRRRSLEVLVWRAGG